MEEIDDGVKTLAGVILRAHARETGPGILNDVARYTFETLEQALQTSPQKIPLENASSYMAFAKGFVDFCGSANRFSDEERNEAFEIFLTEECKADFEATAAIVYEVNKLLRSPAGQHSFKAGQIAAWECQEGRPAAVIPHLIAATVT